MRILVHGLRRCSKAAFVALAFLCVIENANAQWQIVGPNVIVPYDKTFLGGQGAIAFKDGILWAGFSTLSFSSDSGKTWAATNLPVTSEVTAVSFWNADSGMVTNQNFGVYLTTDEGVTWTFSTQAAFTDIYCFSDSDAYAIGTYYGLYETTDNGQTWNDLISIAGPTGSAGPDFGVRQNGSIEAITITNPATNEVSTSSDAGQSWTSAGGQCVIDSWSLGLDSCNDSVMYIASENFYNPMQGGLARLFRTTNAGASWIATFTAPYGYLSGSFSAAADVLYAGTTKNGVLRSTDEGKTWKSIGGPNTVVDSRTLFAASDNTVFALDSLGNVWVTYNSGGDPVLPLKNTSALSVSPSELFSFDTIPCDSLTRTVYFARSACAPLWVKSASLIGADTALYRLGVLDTDTAVIDSIGIDSLNVTFHAAYRANAGSKSAELILALDNGTSDTILLGGYLNIAPQPLALSTQNVQTDTLGGTVEVPIAINGLLRPENVTLVMHYDGDLQYLGSFSIAGTTLDIAGTQSYGRTELLILNALPNEIEGYAKFNVFNDSNDAAHVTFDSMTVTTQTSPCEYSMPAPDTSTITTLSGCGITILSQWLHDDLEPVFSIVPNPTDGTVFITSNMDVGAATIEIYDMLGTKRGELSGVLAPGSPIEAELPESSGVYTVMIHAAWGTRVLAVVKER